MHAVEHLLPDVTATASLASALARLVVKGDVILLEGDLGVGKTAFAKHFINTLLDEPEEVPSPTFTLVQTFQTPDFSIWHFDLYRLQHEEEVYELGIEDAFAEGVSLIEWPGLAEAMLPENILTITLTYGENKGSRKAILAGQGHWQEKLHHIIHYTE